MADMEHNLSLADALTEPPPRIEEEVKRDFIASLEAEKFDDMIGEKVGKTDYVPLLDDDDNGPKAGNQEPKPKPHTDSVPTERTSATGPAAVVENGDHGLGGHRKEPFQMHREDLLSDLLLLPQETTALPAFREDFGAPTGVHAPYGMAELPGSQPLRPAGVFDPLAFLGTDPLQSQDSSIGPARWMGAPEDFWLGTQHFVERQEASFSEPPGSCKVPGVTEKQPPVVGGVDLPGEPSLPEANQAASPVSLPIGSPGPAVEELVGFEPSADHKVLPPEGLQAGSLGTPAAEEQKSEATDTTLPAAESYPILRKEEQVGKVLSIQREEDRQPFLSQPAEEAVAVNFPSQKADDGQPSLALHTQGEESQLLSLKAEDLEGSPAKHIEQDEHKLPFTQQMQEVTNHPSPTQKVDGPPVSPIQKVDGAPVSPIQKIDGLPVSPIQKTDGAPVSPIQKIDGVPVSPIQKIDGVPVSPIQKIDGAPFSPMQPAEKVEEIKVPLSQFTVNQEVHPSSLPSQLVEPFSGQEKLDKNKKPPSTPIEKLKGDKQTTPTKPVEMLLEPAETAKPAPLGKAQADSPEAVVEEPSFLQAKQPSETRPARPAEFPGRQPPSELEAKPEEAKPVAEGAPAGDPGALPHKDLPSSPEKKAKPSAGAPAAKATATKPKPGPAAASPAPSGKRPAFATPGQNKKATTPTAGPAAATPPKRPAPSGTRPSSLTPRDAKAKATDVKSPEKRTSPSKPPSATTPRLSAKTSPATPRPSVAGGTSVGLKSSATSPPKRPSAIKTELKASEAKKSTPKSSSADLARPKSAPASTIPSPPAPGAAAASRPKPKPAGPRPSGTMSVAADPKKTVALKVAPKTSPLPKPLRPPTSLSAPDLKNVRSKIGSTDNIKHQPGGGKAKVERKAESAGAARKPELIAVPKSAVSKEGAPKLPEGKVQILSKKASYSHVQSKCGSKDNIKHVPGGGNVQILNQKIDLSKVSSKCGSKVNIKHKPGGGDIKIENQKLNFKEKAQAKVGSLDNVGHMPAGGAVKTEGGVEAAPESGAVTVPQSGSSAPQANGVGLAAPPLGSGDQREIQCFDTHIQETN